MHASTILSACLLAFGALASPLPDNTTEVAEHLFRRSNTCITDGGAVRGWRINVDNDAAYNKQCGGGCLDNIRGRCGVVTSWACGRDDAGTATYHFYTTSGCTPYDMTQALHACTKMTIDCSKVNYIV
ncbi:hypothetical protein GTA08_BOTSDO09652 [Neofusicoccum parvum]|uniref:Secreted protein n=2 Tax=Neofusicoccum parvum TaxID=310453 RepID=R1E8Y8_BOTPV|nr:hypothetical protein UCRNP2_9403 [Neofusicoccum parvum UCRNP2]GME48370.1 hypothetical protein GTA08_BOTSDO09652 [Neofusicoccum parvum]GME64829.1 hypothetical protein GTA08_BOTSDO09652 [Neofusicoccum parvum]